MPTLIEIVPNIDMLLAMANPQRAHAVLRAVLSDKPQSIEKMIRSCDYKNQLHPQAVDTDAYGERRREAELAVLEAWSWMEAQSILTRTERQQAHYGWCALSLTGAKFYRDANSSVLLATARVRKDDIHPDLHGESLENFWRGSYDLSLFAAMKAVEVAVREAGGFTANDLGVALMRKAFEKDSGPLTDQSAPQAEREALGHLFAGAIGMFKSPNSHRYVDFDPDTCADVLLFASRLLRMVEKRVNQ